MSTQHIATLLDATCCLATLLRHVGCCWLKVDISQPDTTSRNLVAQRTQHVASNNVAICCVDMLRSFGRGFTLITAVTFDWFVGCKYINYLSRKDRTSNPFCFFPVNPKTYFDKKLIACLNYINVCCPN